MSADPHISDAVLSFDGPEGPAPRATVIVVPGRGEQPGVYTRFGTRLAADAYPVHVVNDPVGREALVRAQIAAVLGAPGRPEPAVLVGSDTGALFAAGLLASGEATHVAGLVLAGLPVPEAPEPAANGWDGELDARSTCPTHRGRINDGELVRAGALYEPVPDGWFERATLDRVGVPILGLHGQEDPISPLEAVRDAYAGAVEAELVSIAGAPHDVLNDRTHRTVAATTVLWLERLREQNGLAPLATRELVGVDVA
jgi:alpha-beta hydrolase superfamily lysophospholipase